MIKIQLKGKINMTFSGDKVMLIWAEFTCLGRIFHKDATLEKAIFLVVINPISFTGEIWRKVSLEILNVWIVTYGRKSSFV